MRAVPRTSELARILNLPRRGKATWEDMIDPLSDFLKKPGHVCSGPQCAGGFTRLNILQTQALCEFHDNVAAGGMGLFLQGPLGCGKTGVALFSPKLLDGILGGARALYIVPGAAIKSGKVFSEITALREHWDILNFQTVSYQMLQREEREFFFFEPPGPYNLILCDEIHLCRNERTAVARRISRLHEKAGQEIEITRFGTGQMFRVKVPPKPPMGVMTATPVKDGIKDVGHIMEWTHGPGSPVPRDASDLDDWGGAIDAEPPERFAPGALTVFSGGKEDLESVRRGIGDWIFDTPGCVASEQTFVDAKLEITLRNVPLTDAEDNWFRVLRGDPDDLENFRGMQTPDGVVFTEKAELWRHACSLALGYYTIWTPDAPPEWRRARYLWSSWVREVLAESRTLDTAAQVETHVINGAFRDCVIRDGEKHRSPQDVREAWREIEPTFVLCSCSHPTCQRPHSVPIWVGDTSLQYAAKWLEGGGIVWTGHRHFGRKLSAITGCPFFRDGGLTEDGTQSIVTTRAPGIIASSVACKEMFNLQDRYWRNLYASIWPAGYAVEQSIGRTHRQGQKRPLVTVEWMISCREQLDGFARAASCQAPLMRDFMHVPSRLCGSPVKSDRITSLNRWAFAEQDI